MWRFEDRPWTIDDRPWTVDYGVSIFTFNRIKNNPQIKLLAPDKLKSLTKIFNYITGY